MVEFHGRISRLVLDRDDVPLVEDHRVDLLAAAVRGDDPVAEGEEDSPRAMDSDIDFPSPKRQFGLKHFFIILTGYCIVLASGQYHPYLMVWSCPFVLGPLAGWICSRSASGAVIGWISATFWSLFLTFFFLLYLVAAVSNAADSDRFMPWINSAAITCSFVVSIFSGYIGGRIALH